jgi:hypothetical protein
LIKNKLGLNDFWDLFNLPFTRYEIERISPNTLEQDKKEVYENLQEVNLNLESDPITQQEFKIDTKLDYVKEESYYTIDISNSYEIYIYADDEIVFIEELKNMVSQVATKIENNSKFSGKVVVIIQSNAFSISQELINKCYTIKKDFLNLTSKLKNEGKFVKEGYSNDMIFYHLNKVIPINNINSNAENKPWYKFW